jgi:ABC-type transport system involved in multi-copper enzyme maturation permease subunit
VLWWKAWRESRARFLSGAVILALYCVSAVNRARLDFPPRYEPSLPYTTFIWRNIYNGPDTLMLVVVTLVLGLGGLLRERASGTAPFTLALPVSRWSLLISRAGVGVLETIALATIPAWIVPTLSSRIGHVYPADQAWLFACLFVVVGLAWFAAGFALSVLLDGEHTATAGCLLLPFVYLGAVNVSGAHRLSPVNVFNVMNGRGLPGFDAATSLLSRPIPWTTLTAVLIAAAALLGIAALVTVRRDY